MAVSRYFLGANSPEGFYSLYGELIPRETARAVYILKGGPGCGKSTLLRHVGARAEEGGLDVSYIVCSGDPDSLDGVVLPQLGVALVDGTAPHVVEPFCPGAMDRYVDLGRHYDSAGLYPMREEIRACMEENSACYRRCYRCLSAVGTLERDTRELLLSPALTARLLKRARGILSRELKQEGGEPGRTVRRFLSAVTCQGELTLWETVTAHYGRVYELCDSFSLAHEMLTLMAEAFAARGYDTVVCPDPMCPNRILHLLIPTLSLAFVTSTREQAYPGRPYRRIHLDALITGSEEWKLLRARVRFSHRVALSLAEEALQTLRDAKNAHDRLESLYNPYVDFDGVRGDAEALAAEIGLTASP